MSTPAPTRQPRARSRAARRSRSRRNSTGSSGDTLNGGVVVSRFSDRVDFYDQLNNRVVNLVPVPDLLDVRQMVRRHHPDGRHLSRERRERTARRASRSPACSGCFRCRPRAIRCRSSDNAHDAAGHAARRHRAHAPQRPLGDRRSCRRRRRKGCGSRRNDDPPSSLTRWERKRQRLTIALSTTPPGCGGLPGRRGCGGCPT